MSWMMLASMLRRYTMGAGSACWAVAGAERRNAAAAHRQMAFRAAAARGSDLRGNGPPDRQYTIVARWRQLDHARDGVHRPRVRRAQQPKAYCADSWVPLSAQCG